MTSFKDFRVKLLRTIAPATKALTSCFYTYSTAAAWWRCTVCAGDYGASKTMNKNDSWWLVALFMRYGVSACLRACVCVCVCMCFMESMVHRDASLCFFQWHRHETEVGQKKKRPHFVSLSVVGLHIFCHSPI